MISNFDNSNLGVRHIKGKVFLGQKTKISIVNTNHSIISLIMGIRVKFRVFIAKGTLYNKYCHIQLTIMDKYGKYSLANTHDLLSNVPLNKNI
jgi:hypothetical protein